MIWNMLNLWISFLSNTRNWLIKCVSTLMQGFLLFILTYLILIYHFIIKIRCWRWRYYSCNIVVISNIHLMMVNIIDINSSLSYHLSSLSLLLIYNKRATLFFVNTWFHIKILCQFISYFSIILECLKIFIIRCLFLLKLARQIKTLLLISNNLFNLKVFSKVL